MRFVSDDEFPRSGGRWCLDLVATFGRRHRPDPVERLPDPPALVRWLAGAGLPAPARIEEPELVEVRELREALHRLVRARMAALAPDRVDVEVVNRAAGRPDLVPFLDVEGRVRRDGENEVTVAAAMSTLARDGIDVIATAPAERIRECEHPDCSLLFYDHTQGNRRRWCSMQRCGNQTKVAGYRERRRGTVGPAPAGTPEDDR